MKKKAVFVLSIIIALSALSCSPYYTKGDSFFISRAGAVMPVLVRGNISSGRFIVWLHGGPGDTCMAPENFPALLELEKSVAMVYWDQRASGLSQGNPSIETLTLTDFNSDLDLLFNTLELKYGATDSISFYMLGVSWGGTFGTAWLTDSSRQSRVSGWIEVDGGHNMPLMMELSRDWVKQEAAERVDAGNDAEFWQECLDWYDTLPDDVTMYSVEAHQRHSSYVREADGYRPAGSTASTAPGFDEIFLSSFNFSAFLNASYLMPNFDIRSLNLNDDMASITLPVLLIWGAHDGMSPPDMMANAEAYLGTAPADIRAVLFEDSGHNPFSDEPVKFTETVLDFVDTY